MRILRWSTSKQCSSQSPLFCFKDEVFGIEYIYGSCLRLADVDRWLVVTRFSATARGDPAFFKLDHSESSDLPMRGVYWIAGKEKLSELELTLMLIQFFLP